MRRCPKRTPSLAVRALSQLATVSIWAAGALAEAPRTVPASTFARQIASARQLVAACAANASTCDGSTLPEPETVEGSPAGDFHITWQWLRDDIAAGRTATPAGRTNRMETAGTHLVTLAAEAGTGPATSGVSFAKARKSADVVLARPEFRASIEGPTWTERQLAKVQDWVLRLFTGMDRVGRRAPWLAPLIEWGCFALAVSGLLFFVRQSLARQALRISLGDGLALASHGERDSADWARLAEERAAAEDWREAVHCLYWAGIALMESRRAWRPNATRTPREYVRLLKPGSEAHRLLRDLTRVFEQIWYGHALADGAQYGTSLEKYRALEAAKPERAATEPESGRAIAAVEGA